MDIDDPVRPIDPREDARVYARVRAARRRSVLRIALTLAHPLLAMAGGGLIGGWHADAPLIGAVGMLLAWVAARGVLIALGVVLLAMEAPALLDRLRGAQRPHAAGPGAGGTRGAVVFVVYALAFAGLAMTVGVGAALLGDGRLHGLDVLGFGALGLGLAWLTQWTEPG